MMDIVAFGNPPKLSALGPSDYIRYIHFLLKGLALHAVEGDPGQLRDLQNQIGALAASLNAESTEEDLLVGTAAALRALEEYNRNAAVALKGHVDELRLMLVMMTGTISFLSSSSQTSVGHLQTIEEKLQRASTLEDARQLRAQMADCLSIVRTESSRIQAESKARLTSLQAEVERISSRVQLACSIPRATQ
jgi:hypothetical protein